METDRRGTDQKSLVRQTGPGKIQYVVMILIVIVVGIGAFIGGAQFEKGQKNSSTTAATGGYGAGAAAGRGGFARMGGFGTVTAVSSSSITIDQRSRGAMNGSTSSTGSDTTTSKTYTISSSTTVTDDGSSSSVSAIAVGDSVRIQTASTTSTAVTAIELNPTMGGAPTSSTTN